MITKYIFVEHKKNERIKVPVFELLLTYLSTNCDVFADAYALLGVTVLVFVPLLDQYEPYVQLHFVSNGSSANLARMLFIGDR